MIFTALGHTKLTPQEINKTNREVQATLYADLVSIIEKIIYYNPYCTQDEGLRIVHHAFEHTVKRLEKEMEN